MGKDPLKLGAESFDELIVLGTGYLDREDYSQLKIYGLKSGDAEAIEGHLMDYLYVKRKLPNGEIINVLLQNGRRHFYEAPKPKDNFSDLIRVLKNEYNLKRCLVTHTGGLANTNYPEGQFFLIKEILNLTPNFARGLSIGFEVEGWSVDRSYLPSEWVEGGALVCGLYGPTYETPAETSFFRRIYGDYEVKGMSPSGELQILASENVEGALLSLGVLYTPDIKPENFSLDTHKKLMVEGKKRRRKFLKQLNFIGGEEDQ